MPRRRAVVSAAVACSIVLATRAAAQAPWLDPAPWYAIADTTRGAVAVVSADRFWDHDTGWTAGRFGLTVTSSFGKRSAWFVRGHVLRFDTADLPVLARWPELQGDDAETDWPGTTSPSGLARPELGVIAPVPLPLVGAADAGLALGLPIGPDALYPFSAASIPLRLDLRRTWLAGTAWRIAAQAGAEVTFDSSRDVLAGEAFPDGWRYGVEVAWRPQAWRCAALGYDERRLDGAVSQRLCASAWLPLTDQGHALGLVLAREIGPQADRPATHQVSLLWRFAGWQDPPAGESR